MKLIHQNLANKNISCYHPPHRRMAVVPSIDFITIRGLQYHQPWIPRTRHRHIKTTQPLHIQPGTDYRDLSKFENQEYRKRCSSSSGKLYYRDLSKFENQEYRKRCSSSSGIDAVVAPRCGSQPVMDNVQRLDHNSTT
jgi:hypothetical protein